MNIGIVVQARTGSKRYPKKVLANLKGKMVINWVLERLSYSKRASDFIVATSILEQDDILEKIATKIEWKIARGSELDVLDRYHVAATKYNLDIIVRITSDCPLVDPQIVDYAIEEFKKRKVDYLTVVNVKDGFDTEVFTFTALEEAHKEAKLSSEREHVTPYLITSKKFSKAFIKYGVEDSSAWHLSLDYPEDLQILEAIISRLDGLLFTYQDVVEIVKNNPNILEGPSNKSKIY